MTHKPMAALGIAALATEQSVCRPEGESADGGDCLTARRVDGVAPDAWVAELNGKFEAPRASPEANCSGVAAAKPLGLGRLTPVSPSEASRAPEAEASKQYMAEALTGADPKQAGEAAERVIAERINES